MKTRPLLILALLIFLLLPLLTSCGVGYVAKSSYYQMELLCARVPNAEAKKSGKLTPEEIASLDLVADVKQFGKEIGLKGSKNYDTVALDWDRRIWNISASAPTAFIPETWWFPVVGTVPYLGFFVEESAREVASELKQEGFDVYVRTAGTYSTLGWFEDPLLVPMLSWRPRNLSDVVLHEMTHATVWVNGGVRFNESLANFVGEKASFAYLKDRFGEDSEIYKDALQAAEDREKWRDLLWNLYNDLDAVYKDPALNAETKHAHKVLLFRSLDDRVVKAGFHQEKLYRYVVALGPWNNARLMQFKTYNSSRAWFEAILARENHDLVRFVRAVEDIVEDADDPAQALEAEARTYKGL